MRLPRAMSLSILAAGTAAFLWSPAASAQDNPSQEPPAVYDEKADAHQDLAVALAKARKDHQRVLVVYGANWWGWCRKLEEFFQTQSAVRRELLYEYQVVKVDIGRWDKNLDLVEKHGADIRGKGVPYFTVLAADGSVVTNHDTGSLESGPAHDPDKVLAFLKKHRAEVPDAEDVLKAAFARAGKDGRKLFVHLGAPWWGWCHRLEEFLANPRVAELFAKDFLDVKIDIDRMPHGKEVQKRLRGTEQGGIPWSVILDAKGQEVITADGPQGNIGCPARPHEIEHFMTMLRTARRHLTDADLETIHRELQAYAKKLLGG